MSRPHAGARGFTLVEVMVALFIMAILAAMAFRGVDALVRAKDSALAATGRTLKLNAGMSQFDYDVSQMVDTKALPSALAFDGATLRFARRMPQGVGLVVWTLQDRRWQRWAGAPVTRFSDLTDEWMRSQQWSAISGSAVTVLRDVDDFQAYVCNPNGNSLGTGCSWANIQSTKGTQTDGAASPTVAVLPPVGIRIDLKLPEGGLTRERELPQLW
ncbi:MAG TPA: prepilin-type N-terminal cleavage/methylation domain-containing protein [Burkholderiaceae bacterium]